MPFNLIFFKQKNALIALDDVVLYFSKHKNFSVKPLDDDLYRFDYFNQDTNVSFNIIYNEQNELLTDEPIDSLYEYCYTFFTINYMRPSFFAYESMEIIENFSKNFNLYIYDVQNLDSSILKLYSKEELIESYLKNNELTSIEFNKQYPLLTITKDKTDYFYFYTSARKIIFEEFKVDVPEISFIKNVNTQEISTVFTWDNPSCIIPRCDFILIMRSYKGFLGIKKHTSSLIPYNEVINQFSNMVNKIDFDSFDLYLFQSTDDIKTHELYDELLIEYSHDEYEVIDIDEIVDVTL